MKIEIWGGAVALCWRGIPHAYLYEIGSWPSKKEFALYRSWERKKYVWRYTCMEWNRQYSTCGYSGNMTPATSPALTTIPLSFLTRCGRWRLKMSSKVVWANVQTSWEENRIGTKAEKTVSEGKNRTREKVKKRRFRGIEKLRDVSRWAFFAQWEIRAMGFSCHSPLTSSCKNAYIKS